MLESFAGRLLDYVSMDYWWIIILGLFVVTFVVWYVNSTESRLEELETDKIEKIDHQQVQKYQLTGQNQILKSLVESLMQSKSQSSVDSPVDQFVDSLTLKLAQKIKSNDELLKSMNDFHESTFEN